MGRRLKRCAAILLALDLTLAAAEARDPKIDLTRDSENHQGGSVSRATNTASLVATSLESRHSALIEGKNANATTPGGERKTLTLFHFNSKFGRVGVQPLFGSVKGAQFSLGF